MTMHSAVWHAVGWTVALLVFAAGWTLLGLLARVAWELLRFGWRVLG